MEIGIVGFGVVGNVTFNLLKQEHRINIFDPAIGHSDDLSECEMIFICINEKDPTMKNLDELIDVLVKTNTKAIFVIRTTVMPGTTDRYIKTHNRDFAYMPEFIREWNVKYDTFHPDKIVIGTEDMRIWETLWMIFSWFIVADRIVRVRPVEAEMAKLALNSLYLIKVVYAEQLFDMTQKYDCDYKKIYKIFQLDQQINERHLIPGQDGYRGASGKCLPKDSNFMLYAAGVMNMKLLRRAIELNSRYLKGEREE